MSGRVKLLVFVVAATSFSVWLARAAEPPETQPVPQTPSQPPVQAPAQPAAPAPAQPAAQPSAKPAVDAPTQPAAEEPAFKIPDNERPFWENAQKFVDAYAMHDAKALGELFTSDAEVYDEFGTLTVGREDIVKMYQQVFEQTPEARIEEVRLEKVRFLTDNVAVEQGQFVSIPEPDAAPRTSRYFVIHVKQPDGRWQVSLVRDFPQDKPYQNEHLQPLEWLVGEWVSEDDDSLVQSDCRWSDDGNYLLRTFKVRIDDEVAMQGEQRIGWDAARQQIYSWMFDSQGGFVESVWHQDGDEWVVESEGETSDGEKASGTAIYSILDAEMVTWQHRNVIVGDGAREDGDPVVMVRRPPAPEAKP